MLVCVYLLRNRGDARAELPHVARGGTRPNIGNEEERSPMSTVQSGREDLVRVRAGDEASLSFVLAGNPGTGPWSLEIAGENPPLAPLRIPLGREIPPEPCRVDLRFPAPPSPGVYRATLRDGSGRELAATRLVAWRHDPRRWVEPFDGCPEGLPPDRWTGTGARDETYVRKERTTIPLDFDFRYSHHDFLFLDAHVERLGRRILHLGCNAGIGSIILARLGFAVHGVDIQREAIEEAIRLRAAEPADVASRLTFQWASFETMALPRGWFDAAIAFDVLEHLYPEDLDRLLDRVATALRPGGHLLVHVPEGDSFADPAHVRRFTRDGFREEIGRRFRVIHCETVDEHDGQGNRRIDLVARLETPPSAPREETRTESLLARVDSFDSSFFNERYTPEKARRLLREMIEAVPDRRPFSLVRLGDNEVRLLGYGLVPIGERTLAEEAAHLRLHTGVDPLALTLGGLRRLREEFLATAREADVLATHRFTVNADWHEEAERVLGHLGLPYGPREVDVAWNAEVLDRGFLLPLLGMGRVLLIGNPAPKWARLLGDPGYRERYAFVGMPRGEIDLAGAIFVPHEGTAAFDRLEQLWDEVRRHEFDLALVAASVVGKLLVGRIRRELGKVALDIGWNMQFLADCSSPVGSARQPGRRGFRNLFRGRGEPGGLPPDGPRDV